MFRLSQSRRRCPHSSASSSEGASPENSSHPSLISHWSSTVFAVIDRLICLGRITHSTHFSLLSAGPSLKLPVSLTCCNSQLLLCPLLTHWHSPSQCGLDRGLRRELIGLDGVSGLIFLNYRRLTMQEQRWCLSVYPVNAGMDVRLRVCRARRSRPSCLPPLPAF